MAGSPRRSGRDQLGMADGELNFDVVVRGFSRLTDNFRAAVSRAVGRGARLVQSEAVLNAPKSPTKEQYEQTLKRKKHSDRRKGFDPGGLERSIRVDRSADGMEATVFVAQNAEAGAYAVRIHDEKNVTWFRRGVGTQAKGARADEKFIERAMEENEQRIAGFIDKAIETELKHV